VTIVGDLVVRHLRHLEIDDESDELLHALARSLVTGIERAGEVAYGTPDCPAERVLTDPAVCPAWALPHAQQYTGGVTPPRPPGLTDEQWIAYWRQAAIQPFGALRGSPSALLTHAAAYLTAGANLRIVQRYGGDPFLTLVIARPDECPDPDALVAAVNADDVVIGGGRVDLALVNGVTWAELAATSWQDLAAVPWHELADGTYTP
jgi:hypothetical protein